MIQYNIIKYNMNMMLYILYIDHIYIYIMLYINANCSFSSCATVSGLLKSLICVQCRLNSLIAWAIQRFGKMTFGWSFMSDMYILGVAKKPWFTVGKHHHHHFSGGLFRSFMIHYEPVFWQDPLYNHDLCCFSISFFCGSNTVYDVSSFFRTHS